MQDMYIIRTSEEVQVSGNNGHKRWKIISGSQKKNSNGKIHILEVWGITKEQCVYETKEEGLELLHQLTADVLL